MEAFCREAAEQSQKTIVLFEKREQGQVKFTPFPKKSSKRYQ